MTNFNEILNTYSKETQQIIRIAIFAQSMAGTKKAPETEEEFKAFCEEAIADHEKAEAERAREKAKREEAKARKIARDLENGITPEMRKAMTYARRYNNEIAELESKLAELKAKRDYWEKKSKG